MTETVRRGPAAKKLLQNKFGIKAKSIRRGRGTGYRWLDITLAEGVEVSPAMRNSIERALVEAGLCGTYYTDHGIDDHYVPCVLWNR